MKPAGEEREAIVVTRMTLAMALTEGSIPRRGIPQILTGHVAVVFGAGTYLVSAGMPGVSEVQAGGASLATLPTGPWECRPCRP